MPKEASKSVQQLANRSQVAHGGIFHKPVGKGSIDLIKTIVQMAKEKNNEPKGKTKGRNKRG